MIIENIKTKPELNEYMGEVFSYHLNRFINVGKEELIFKEVERVIDLYNKIIGDDDQLEKYGIKDILDDAKDDDFEKHYNFINLLEEEFKEDEPISSFLKDKANNDVIKIKNSKKEYVKKHFDGSYSFNLSLHKVDLFEPFFGLSVRNIRSPKCNRIELKFDATNIASFKSRVFEIYGEEKIRKVRWSTDGGLWTIVKVFKGYTPGEFLMHILGDSHSRLGYYKFNFEKIFESLNHEVQNIIYDLLNVFNSILEYQKYIKESQLRSNLLIDKIKENSNIRKLQLDFESNNTEKYEIQPLPKYLREKFGKESENNG